MPRATPARPAAPHRFAWRLFGERGLELRPLDPADAAAHADLLRLAREWTTAPPAGAIDLITAPSGILLLFDEDPARHVEAVTRALAAPPSASAPPAREHRVPFAADADSAPDLRLVARHAGLEPDAWLARFTELVFTVAAIGFVPGFPYLEGLPAALHLPRRATPRTKVPAGSVAIGGAYAGIYPVDSPAGWHVVGRTGLALFDPAATPPARFAVGDRVRFVLAAGPG